jgi:hypothetical protein
MSGEEEPYHELLYYTLAHPGPQFIHQHAVDAYAAQNATSESKPIGIVFALIGLYLWLEEDFTGKEVQRAHMQLGRKRRTWPTFEPPKDRGIITVADVVREPPGGSRDAMIRAWSTDVWNSWRSAHDQVIALVARELNAT